MRVKVVVEYDGTNYCGFQTQPNGLTVQQVLEDALQKLLKQNIKITPSGRTDSGVHAFGQVAHFDYQGSFDMLKLPFAIAQFLPRDIAILSAEICADDFHARYSAKSKTYQYKILMSKLNRPLYLNRYYICPYAVDVNIVKSQAKLLIGEHDFYAFMSSGSSVMSTVRQIYSLEVFADGEELIIEISANGFLYNMVRIIVGTLIDVGRGRLPLDTITKMIELKDRTLGGATAPACGLYLKHVEY